MPQSIPVGCLQAGQAAQISRIVGRTDDVHRLEEFGLRKGTEVVMFRPGNPCILRMAGNKICLRADDLLSVFVTLMASPC